MTSEWTPDTLKEYSDALRIADQRALDVALAAMNHRLEFLNELRSVVSDQAANFVTRKEMDITTRYEATSNKTNSSRIRGLIISVISVSVGIVGLAFGIISQLVT